MLYYGRGYSKIRSYNNLNIDNNVEKQKKSIPLIIPIVIVAGFLALIWFKTIGELERTKDFIPAQAVITEISREVYSGSGSDEKQSHIRYIHFTYEVKQVEYKGKTRTALSFFPLIKSVGDEYTVYYSETNARDIRDNSMINSAVGYTIVTVSILLGIIVVIKRKKRTEIHE